MLCAGSAHAAMDMLTRDTTCKPVLTVQKHGCHVENYFRCRDVGVGYFRQETFDIKGLYMVRHYSQWRVNPIADQILRGNRSANPNPKPAFSAEVSEQLVVGSPETAEAFPEIRNNVLLHGMLVTNGEQADLHGVVAVPMQFFALMPAPGGGTQEMFAQTYYLSELDVEIYGESSLGTRRLGNPVAQIIQRDQSGFGSETPVNDCRMLSALRVPQGGAS